jgi:hypothetical protein|tara:strand:+ start:118 stop:453 length:336 start_codon:yes stop_codon:yes gene_type:complete
MVLAALIVAKGALSLYKYFLKVRKSCKLNSMRIENNRGHIKYLGMVYKNWNSITMFKFKIRTKYPRICFGCFLKTKYWLVFYKNNISSYCKSFPISGQDSKVGSYTAEYMF